MGRIRSDVGDDKSNENGAAMQRFLVEKLGAAIFEFANRGLAQRTAAAVGKIETPLMGLRIVQPQGQRFYVPSRTIDFEHQQIGSAIPDLSDESSTFIFGPGSGAA